MRTKALLCLAVLAAGLATSVAQNVYSLNIVGYATVAVPAGYSLLANPLKAGTNNTADEVLPAIPDVTILTWNGAGFDFAQNSSLIGGWVDANLNSISAPSLPPGKGFFLNNPGAATTITFVGEVVPGPGAQNALPIKAGYNLIGSVLPVAGTDITAAPVSLPLIADMTILTWTGTTYKFAQNSSLLGGWVDADLNSISAPAYSIGQGFFLNNPGTATTWTQSLP